MTRTLTRPMFRKGGEVKRSNYMGGGIKAVRPRYMGGGMTGIMSGIQPDAGLTPRTGYQEGSEPGFFRNILNAINPTSGDVIQRIQKREQETPLLENIFKPAPIEFRTQEEADAYLLANPEYTGEIKIKETGKTIDTKIPTGTPEGSTSNVPGTPIVPKGPKKKKTITQQLDDTPSDEDTIKSYMDMFQAALGEDEEDITRDKYLQLAKFGANLLAQPGGDLVGAIGKAAAPSIEGVAKTAAAQRAGKREINLAAIKTALAQMDPTELEKRYDFLKGKFPDKSDIEIANMLISGETGKARTKETRITTNAESLVNLDPDKRLIVARSIEESGVGFEKFRQLPKDDKGNIKTDTKDGYYYDEDGTLYQIEEGNLGELSG
jgi:hypothetical protein